MGGLKRPDGLVDVQIGCQFVQVAIDRAFLKGVVVRVRSIALSNDVTGRAVEWSDALTANLGDFRFVTLARIICLTISTDTADSTSSTSKTSSTSSTGYLLLDTPHYTQCSL